MKNKKITRKEFVLKTSKVAGGLILCPALLSSLSSCSDPASSSLDSCDINSDGLIATCNFHGAQFNTDGCPVSGPTKNNLIQYTHEPLNGDILTISIDNFPENINISEEGEGVLLNIGGSLLFSSQVLNSALLVYRKNNDEFNIFSTVCPHEQGDVGLFL